MQLTTRTGALANILAGQWLVAEPSQLRPFYGVCVKDIDPQNDEERETRFDIAPSSFEAALSLGTIVKTPAP
jgi:hypothetical protein